MQHPFIWAGSGLARKTGMSEIAIKEKMNGTEQDGMGQNEIEW